MARMAGVGFAERVDFGQSAKPRVQRLLVKSEVRLVATPAPADTSGWRFGSGRDGGTVEEMTRRKSGGVGVPWPMLAGADTAQLKRRHRVPTDAR